MTTRKPSFPLIFCELLVTTFNETIAPSIQRQNLRGSSPTDWQKQRNEEGEQKKRPGKTRVCKLSYEKRKKQRNVQQPEFPGGHPPKYYSAGSRLDCREQTGSGIHLDLWPYMGKINPFCAYNHTVVQMHLLKVFIHLEIYPQIGLCSLLGCCSQTIF